MQRYFHWFYRGMLVLCVVGMLWSVLAAAQNARTQEGGTGNSAEAATTNIVAAANPSASSSRGYVTFGLDEFPILRETTLVGVPLWQYAASSLYILLAFLSARVINMILGGWLKRSAAKTASGADDLIIELIHGPVKTIAFVVFLNIGLSVFEWPTVAEVFLAKIFVIVVAISLTRMLVKIVDILVKHWMKTTAKEEDRGFDELLFPVICKSLKAFTVIVAFLLTTSNLGVDITGVIASLSIGGLAIGLAAQDTLANLFGAVAIFMDKPFRLGDRIQLESVDGNVEAIGLRSTRIRNLDGHLISVPNKTMGTAIITNVTKRPNIKTIMQIAITYDTPLEKLKRALAILHHVYKENPKTFDAIITFRQFSDSSLNIEVVHWWNGTDAKEFLAGLQEMNLAVKEQFDSEGINFAFPTRTIYLKQEPAVAT